ncbi:reverse transcriptase family protein [Virgisporangium aurantiacum]|nr:reverse transcriptase family protein [Virgisporangium aurantiacum]
MLQAAIEQAARVERRGLAHVLTLNHLAHRTGAPYPYLREIVERKRDPYHVFEIRRRVGGSGRVISSPDPTLMHVQRWILSRILNHVPVHPASFAYRTGFSIRACASQHLGADWLVKLDLHNFFHTIDERQVYQVIRQAGYTRLVALEIARLCTRQSTGTFPGSRRFHAMRIHDRVIANYTTNCLGFLPQGAPTSGALANLVARPLDDRLTAIADDHQLVYTRYADDIVLSGLGPFNRAHAASIIRLAGTAIRESGFEPHDGKTRVVPPGARRIVLGLLIDGERLRVPRDTRSRIEAHVYGAERFGLVHHQINRKFASALGLVRYVDGLLAFAHDVDPTWATPWWERWRRLVLDQAAAIAPFGPDSIVRAPTSADSPDQ